MGHTVRECRCYARSISQDQFHVSSRSGVCHLTIVTQRKRKLQSAVCGLSVAARGLYSMKQQEKAGPLGLGLLPLNTITAGQFDDALAEHVRMLMADSCN